jgi:hypothetical protein
MAVGRKRSVSTKSIKLSILFQASMCFLEVYDNSLHMASRGQYHETYYGRNLRISVVS